MYRRCFITAAGLTALTALAGCSSDNSPPPRKSSVVERIESTDDALNIHLTDRPWVLSRYEPTSDLRGPADLAPVGVAEAKGGILGGSGSGRGATGRGSGGHSNAPTTTHGWAWWHGGDYTDDWYENHEDEVTRYDVRISEVGVRSFGLSSAYPDDRPGAGPVDWDQLYDSPDGVVEHSMQTPGWYRVGVHIVGTNTKYDFKWECVDFELVDDGLGYEVTKGWKVSPRI